MRLEDIPAGLRLCRASGWNQRDEDWRALLSLNPGGFIAAVGDGRVVGTGGAVRYGPALGWVCMILVDPESRNQGLGTRVMEEVLRRLDGVAVVGLDAAHIGPVVARRPEMARDLVRACLAAHAGRRFFLDAPREPAEWPRALAELGFAEQRPFTRMYRGEGHEPGRPAELYAVVGPEFG